MDYQKIRNKISEGKEIVERYKHETPQPVLDVCYSMFEINEMLVDKLEELDNKISKNSSNSSLPPSRDPNRNRGNKNKTGKKNGGQTGHKGSTLARVANPDAVIKHRPKGKCRCGKQLSDLKLDMQSSRQVFEIEILKKSIEHQVYQGVCGCGEKHCASYPDGVNAPVQYGASVRAIVAYLSKYQLVPYERVEEMMGELFDCPLS